MNSNILPWMTEDKGHQPTYAGVRPQRFCTVVVMPVMRVYGMDWEWDRLWFVASPLLFYKNALAIILQTSLFSTAATVLQWW